MDAGLPPYLRIVADIRRRIGSGELRPGDRVPSARQITRDHGVAIATATKVLAELRREGLVEAVPGRGTVVTAGPEAGRPAGPGAGQPAGPRPPQPAGPQPPQPAGPRPAQATGRPGPPAGARRGGHPAAAQGGRPGAAGPPELTRDRIVRTAVRIADAEGMAALSMRRIATELGVATMTLYRHVPGKDDLVLFMIDQALAAQPFPAVRPTGWRARLEAAARLQWTLFRRHRWLAAAMSVTRPQLAPHALAHTEWVLSALEELGLEPAAMIYVHVMLFSYVRGVATSMEAEAEAERDTGMTSDEWMATQDAALNALVGAGPYPTARRVLRDADIDLDLDTLFEFGLARMLDGLAARLNPRRRTPS